MQLFFSPNAILLIGKLAIKQISGEYVLSHCKWSPLHHIPYTSKFVATKDAST